MTSTVLRLNERDIEHLLRVCVDPKTLSKLRAALFACGYQKKRSQPSPIKVPNLVAADKLALIEDFGGSTHSRKKGRVVYNWNPNEAD